MKLRFFLDIWFLHFLSVILFLLEISIFFHSMKQPEIRWAAISFFQEIDWSMALLRGTDIALLLIGGLLFFEVVRRVRLLAPYLMIKKIYCSYAGLFLLIACEFSGLGKTLMIAFQESIIVRILGLLFLFSPTIIVGIALTIYEEKGWWPGNKIVTFSRPFLKICGGLIFVIFTLEMMFWGQSWDALLFFILLGSSCAISFHIASYVTEYYRLRPVELSEDCKKPW